MSLRVHHLNCATMCPSGGRVLFGEANFRMCAHVLVVETNDGLVLVDTGLGLGDVAAPTADRLGGPFLRAARPMLRVEETAANQIEALGFSRDDVRHIVPTHLDVDHAGGMADFPRARVHVMTRERDVALERPTRSDRDRYRAAHFEHGPDWRVYEPAGEPWNGFECVRDLDGLPPEILLVPLYGHSKGHAAVAVRTADRWLLHCGDGYFHRNQVAAEPSCPAGLRLFQWYVAVDNRQRLANSERVQQLAVAHPDDIAVFCAHDEKELNRLKARPHPS